MSFTSRTAKSDKSCLLVSNQCRKELLALDRCLRTGTKALFILPYISVAREKLHHLQNVWRTLDVAVRAFIGAQSAALEECQVAVCTIEKASALINRCIEQGRLHEIGTVIIDELHMVFDQRGFLIESMVAKFLFFQDTRTDGGTFQLIGMSATLDELDQLARWMRAIAYRSNFRPVALRETILVKGQLCDLQTMEPCKDEECEPIVDQPTCRLALDAVVAGGSVLAFCPWKAETEKVALAIAKYFQMAMEGKKYPTLTGRLQRMEGFVAAFEKKTGTIDPILKITLPAAVAYHHAGLTVEERSELENAFRTGHIRVLVATSTLSSGVNLPADMVIVHAIISRATTTLNRITFQQMVGRAGRLGHSVQGRSVLICRDDQLKQVHRIITTPIIHIPSKQGRDIERLVLEAVCSGLCSNVDQLQRLIDLTLAGGVLDCEWLQRNDFLSLTGDRIRGSQLGQATIRGSQLGQATIRGSQLGQATIRGSQLGQATIRGSQLGQATIRGSQLGQATLAAGLSPIAALSVFADLNRAMRDLCLSNELHLLYLVTPLTDLWQSIDWSRILELWCRLSPDARHVANLVDVSEQFIIARMKGQSIASTDRRLQVDQFDEYRLHVQIHKRFINAMALFELINERPLAIVAHRFRVNRGALQSLQQQAATYAYMVTAFCDRLGWNYLHGVLDGFAERLAFGVRRDLTELVRIEGMDATRARAFHAASLATLSALASARLEDVSRVLRCSVPFVQGREQVPWLFNEPPMDLETASSLLIERARQHVLGHFRKLGMELAPAKSTNKRRSKSRSSFIPDRTMDPFAELDENDQVFEPVDVLLTSIRRVTLSPKTKLSTPFEVINHLSCLLENLKRDDQEEAIDCSADMFPSFLGSSPILSCQLKRVRSRLESPLLTSSPSTRSPALKLSRLRQWNNASTMEDVCRELKQSRDVGIALSMVNKSTISGVALYFSSSGRSVFLSLYDEDSTIDDEDKENLCTPTESVSLSVRLAAIKRLLECGKKRKLVFDLQRVIRRLYPELGNLRLDGCICIRTIAFLNGHDVSEGLWKTASALPECPFTSIPMKRREAIDQSARLTFWLFEQLVSANPNRSLTIEIATSQLLAMVECRGFALDAVKCDRLIEAVRLQMANVEEKGHSLIGTRFSFESPKELAQILFVRLELLHPNSVAGDGRRHYSTGKAVLRHLESVHALPGYILEWRRLQNALSSLLSLRQCQDQDGRLRCVFDQLSATGRIPTVKPNIQAVPKAELVDGLSARSIFVASSAADFCQLEFRLLAHLSGDVTLRKRFQSSHMDIFQQIVDQWRMDYQSSFQLDRQKIKQLCYGMIYGMGSKSVAEELAIDRLDAQKLIERFFRSFPRVKSWMEEVTESCKENGIICTLFGRCRRLETRGSQNTMARIKRQAINSIIQGSACDIFKSAMIRVQDAVRDLGGHLVMQVHDEIIVEVPICKRIEAVDVVRRAMEQCEILAIPLPVKVTTGDNWQQLK